MRLQLKNGVFRDYFERLFTAETWFDRSTQLTALRPSKGNLTTLASSTLLRVILREIEG